MIEEKEHTVETAGGPKPYPTTIHLPPDVRAILERAVADRRARSLKDGIEQAVRAWGEEE